MFYCKIYLCANPTIRQSGIGAIDCLVEYLCHSFRRIIFSVYWPLKLDIRRFWNGSFKLDRKLKNAIPHRVLYLYH